MISQKSSLSVVDQFRKAKFDTKEKLPEFEVVAFLKKIYEVSYQEASAMVREINGAKKELPYVRTKDLVHFLNVRKAMTNLSRGSSPD